MQRDLFPKHLFLNEGFSAFEASRNNRKLYYLGLDMIRYGLEVTENCTMGTEELTKQFISHRNYVKGVYEKQDKSYQVLRDFKERDVRTFPLHA